MNLYPSIFQNRVSTLSGAQGDLIIANTFGIHRGAPVTAGTRYALTNYYYPNGIPSHMPVPIPGSIVKLSLPGKG